MCHYAFQVSLSGLEIAQCSYDKITGQLMDMAKLETRKLEIKEFNDVSVLLLIFFASCTSQIGFEVPVLTY